MWSKISIATLGLVFPATRGSQRLQWRPRSEKWTQTPARNQTTHLDVIQQCPKLSNRRKDESFSYLPGNFPCSPSNKILCFFLGVVSCWKGGLRQKYHSPFENNMYSFALLHLLLLHPIRKWVFVHFPISTTQDSERLSVLFVISVLDCCCWTLWSYWGSPECEQTFRTWML